MKWISYGNRKNSMLAANFKMIAWSEGLKKEIGVRLKDFIINSRGDQFVVEDQIEKVDSRIKNGEFGLEYIDKTYEVENKMLELLKQNPVNFSELFNGWIQSTTYFYIAVEVSYIYYEKTDSEEVKKKIEKWRDDGNLYKADLLTIKKLSEATKLSMQFIHNCTLEEIKDITNGVKVDKQKIEQRFNKPRSLILQKGKVELVLEDLNPLKKQLKPQIRTLKGQSAFKLKEKIQGVVGKDILVIGMTKPDMVTKMRKMKAVITDEGGVLCHAAITAREFKIPTIIGTKFATQLLKKGALVEIDADKGVVKKLN